MICTNCGNLTAHDARFCTHCGAVNAVAAPIVVDRVRCHLQTLGILWIVYTALRVLSSIVGMTFLHHFLGRHTYGWMPFWPLAGVSLSIGILCAAVTAYALHTRQPWGRIVAIIAAILALFHPVLGTALGIYTLWVLAPAASGISYEREVQQRPVL